MNAVDRARNYLARIPSAVSGSGGHAATYRAACRVREFGLSWDEALSLLAEWNETHCQPKWTDSELEHKLADAFRKVVPQSDFLQRNGAAVRRSPSRYVAPQRTRPDCGANAPRTMPRIPTHHRGTEHEIATLAALRGVSVAGLQLASERGVLRFGVFMERDAWFILDRSGRIAQARRLDGQPWFERVKAWTLKRSQAQWPVGIEEAQPFPIVALTEGGGDMLALCHLIAHANRTDIASVSVLGSAMNIHPDALPHFRGKCVRVFAQSDDAGRKAEDRWTEQLQTIAASVESINVTGLRFDTDSPPSDWNELIRFTGDPFKAFYPRLIFPDATQ